MSSSNNVLHSTAQEFQQFPVAQHGLIVFPVFPHEIYDDSGGHLLRHGRKYRLGLALHLLEQLPGGNEYMDKATYDTEGVGKDIFKVIAANAPLYTALYRLDDWVDAGEDAKSKGYAYQQTVSLTPDDLNSPTVTADSKFLPYMGTLKTGVAETDDILKEALTIIANGVTTVGAGTVTTLVREKPVSDIPVVWTLRTEG